MFNWWQSLCVGGAIGIVLVITFEYTEVDYWNHMEPKEAELELGYELKAGESPITELSDYISDDPRCSRMHDRWVCEPLWQIVEEQRKINEKLDRMLEADD